MLLAKTLNSSPKDLDASLVGVNGVSFARYSCPVIGSNFLFGLRALRLNLSVAFVQALATKFVILSLAIPTELARFCFKVFSLST